MRTFTHCCYIDLVRANWGMGAMAPMGTQKRSTSLPRRVYKPLLAKALPARHDKQETPASATNTPEVMTNIRTRNVDGTNCRP